MADDLKTVSSTFSFFYSIPGQTSPHFAGDITPLIFRIRKYNKQVAARPFKRFPTYLQKPEITGYILAQKKSF